jgi:hypothetical protein
VDARRYSLLIYSQPGFPSPIKILKSSECFGCCIFFKKKRWHCNVCYTKLHCLNSSTTKSRDSSVGISTGYGRGSIPSWDNVFIFSIASRPPLRPTQAHIQWVPWVKRQGLEAGHSLPSSAEIKNDGDIPSTPIRIQGVVLN